MLRPLHIIASCTDRKRLRPPDDLRLREIAALDPIVRVSRWWERLQTHQSESMRAVDLYLGDHWAIVRELSTSQVAFRTQLWAASGGYGLVPASAPLHAYSATFVSGHPDSIARHQRGSSRVELVRTWWDTLNDLPGPERFAPRTIAELAYNDPQACILVVASPNYVCAMENDLLKAAKGLANPDRLVVVCSWSSVLNGAVAHHLVYSDARLQTKLRGSRQSLNARLAKDILENTPHADLSAERLRAYYTRVTAESEPAPRYGRHKMTDEEVKRFIRGALAEAPNRSCSSLLREFRDGNRACEQFRFRGLFHEVRQEICEQTHAA